MEVAMGHEPERPDSRRGKVVRLPSATDESDANGSDNGVDSVALDSSEPDVLDLRADLRDDAAKARDRAAAARDARVDITDSEQAAVDRMLAARDREAAAL